MHDLLVSLASGGVTGAIECAVCQPFDMVKTRHQLHSGKNPSTLQSLRAIHLEGGVSRFYRGVLPELAGMVPKSMSMYAAYDMSQRWLVRHTSIDAVTTAFLAGIASGPAEAIVVQPFQVVKVRMQAKEHLGRYSSSLDCAVQVRSRRLRGAAAEFQVGALRSIAPIQCSRANSRGRLPATDASGRGHRRFRRLGLRLDHLAQRGA